MKDFAFVEQKYYIVIAIALTSPDTSILVTDDDDTLFPVLYLLVNQVWFINYSLSLMMDSYYYYHIQILRSVYQIVILFMDWD